MHDAISSAVLAETMAARDAVFLVRQKQPQATILWVIHCLSWQPSNMVVRMIFRRLEIYYTTLER